MGSAGSEPRVPGRFRGRFRTTGSGKVPGQFFERRVPGRFRGRFRITGSGKVPGQAPNDRFREGSGSVFRTTFRTTGSGKVPGQVPIHEFLEEYGLCLNIQHIYICFFFCPAALAVGSLPI